MTEEDRIKEVLYKFEDGGLISKDMDQILSCISDTIIGIGIGEQGFVTSKNDIIDVFTAGLKEENEVSHFLDFGRTEIRLLREDISVLCADVIVTTKCGERVTQSRFSQSLTLIKEENEWKICCLHASTPIVTEENIDAYPLKFAEKTLQSLRDKIGEEVYAVEEQYRMAVLSDTIAFYIVNFSKDIYEKCQLNSEICAYVEDGTPYGQYAKEHISDYVAAEDRESYLKFFSLKNIDRAYQNDEQEVKYEYRMRSGKKGSFIWVMTVIRLITDIVTGERKGIMYVKNIDDSKRQQIVMQKRAEYDAVLSIYNKNTFNIRVDSLSKQVSGVFMMLDIDDFKNINDTFGHPLGDIVLIKIANTLKAAFPEDAVIGRLGGDEFGIFLPADPGREQMELYMKILYERISAFRFREDTSVDVSFSVGIALTKGKNFAGFYKAADAALYVSKQGGKNRFSFYDE